MTKRKLTAAQARNLTPSEIARTVSVALAAETATLHFRDNSAKRALDALHEAAHVVVGTIYGIGTAFVFIPILSLHARGHATTMQVPCKPKDRVTPLEEAVTLYSGATMEQVFDKLGAASFALEAGGDLLQAWQELQAFQDDLDRAFIPAMERVHGRTLTPTQKSKIRARWLDKQCDRMLKNARVLVGQNFQVVDAVAAMILCGGNDRGMAWWTAAHHDWLVAELAKAPECRDSAARKPMVSRPRWLGQLAARNKPVSFDRLRRIFAEHEAGEPALERVIRLYAEGRRSWQQTAKTH